MSGSFIRHTDDLPGDPVSPWLASTFEGHYPRLEGRVSADVCIVGAGITGLSTAIECLERGLSVVVLERDRVGSGTTGKSAGVLTSQHGLCYANLERRFGSEAATTYATLAEAAIDTVETRLESLSIDAGFERRPAYCYGDDPNPFQRELEAARSAGLSASLVRSVPPFERASAAIRFDEQAVFHPQRYLLGIAETLHDDGRAAVFERSRVTDVHPGTDPTVETDEGTVSADYVVLATGFPLLDRAGYTTRLYPRRSLVLGIRLDGDPPRGTYYHHDDGRFVRTSHDAHGPLVFVGGERHKTGQGGSIADRYRRLERWTRTHFPLEWIAFRWAAQDYVSVDGLPFIGPVGPATPNVHVATGFSGWGLTMGTVAGQLLARSLGRERPSELELFDPTRFTPIASAPKAAAENADAASQFATDWLRTLFERDERPIRPGEGRIRRRGISPVAVARDDVGDLHTVSGRCPHCHALLAWNDAECSWDCPCHGSRFTPDGTVIEGPAGTDLPPRSLE
ncbi:FAD-dependent oxidoreductase [Natrialbaceae archaeon A-CW2]